MSSRLACSMHRVRYTSSPSSSDGVIGAAPVQQRRCAASSVPVPVRRRRRASVCGVSGGDQACFQCEQQHDQQQQQQQQQQQHHRRGTLAAIAAAAAGAAASGLAPARAALLVDDAAATAVFDAARAAVVAVGVAGPGVAGSGSAAPTAALEPLGSGTVFALADGGEGGGGGGGAYVLTNYHVISKYVLDRNAAGGLRVVAAGAASGGTGSGDSIVLNANIIGADANRDLAVLLVDGPLPPEALLRPLPVGAASRLRVGQAVFALGARYGGTGADGTAGGGGGQTMSAGVVSGLQRAIPTPVGTRVYGCIQVDAVVNAANSGGPLVDSAGRLVGLNTAPFTSKNLGRGGGVNFALPSELLVEVVPNLIVYGNASARGVRGSAP